MDTKGKAYKLYEVGLLGDVGNDKLPGRERDLEGSLRPAG
jgi:hypothetical protein